MKKANAKKTNRPALVHGLKGSAPDQATKTGITNDGQMATQPSQNNQADPPEKEWHLDKVYYREKLCPAEWNYCLNYEYARSWRPLVLDVLELKKRQPIGREVGTMPDLRKGFQFAAFLHRHFPEFPFEPWSSILKDERLKRLQKLEVDFNRSSFTESHFIVHDPDCFCDDIAMGDLHLGPNSVLRDKLAIFEIDFTQNPPFLCDLFQQWLEHRIEELKAKGSGSRIGIHTRGRVGQRANDRCFRNYLKALGALRLIAHCGDWEEACRYSAKSMGDHSDKHGLYANARTAWERPQAKALELLARFDFAWKKIRFPSFILDPQQYSGNHWRTPLAKPLPTDDNIAGGRDRYALIQQNVLGYRELRELERSFQSTPVQTPTLDSPNAVTQDPSPPIPPSDRQ